MPNMVRQRDDFGREVGLIHEVLVTGRGVGAGKKFWGRLTHDRKLFAKVVAFVARDGYEATTIQRVARNIMRKNMLGIEEVIQCFGVKPSKRQLTALQEVPFTEAVLEKHKDTHILVASFPISIRDIHDNTARDHSYFPTNSARFHAEASARKKGKVGWHLISKSVVENSTDKTWKEQLVLLSEYEEVPEARVMTYAILLYYLTTGEWLFKDSESRCQTLEDGSRICVGCVEYGALSVSYAQDGDRFHDIGVASSLKRS